MAGVKSSTGLKAFFVYGLLGLVPMGFLAVSVVQDFALTKIAVLVFLLLLLLSSGVSKKLR
jgi:hypothetical protein